MTKLETRTGLPDALRVLVKEYPRDIWRGHENFDGLTRFWMERHLAFRDLLGRLTAVSENFLDKGLDENTYARQTAKLASLFLNQLHGHHQIEDHHYFPLLSAQDSRLDKGFEILDADHHVLDANIHLLAEATNTMLEGGADLRNNAGVLHTRLLQFHTFLDRHLVDEEDLVVPVILKYAPRIDG